MNDNHKQKGIYSALEKTKSNIQLLDNFNNTLYDIENYQGDTLQSVNTRVDDIINRLDLYANTAEAYSEQFDKSISDYKDQASLLVSLIQSCKKNSNGDCIAIPSQKEMAKIYAEKLDFHEYHLETVKSKAAQAKKLVIEMRKMRKLQKSLEEMDRSIEEVDIISNELKLLEKQ